MPSLLDASIVVGYSQASFFDFPPFMRRFNVVLERLDSSILGLMVHQANPFSAILDLLIVFHSFFLWTWTMVGTKESGSSEVGNTR
jgi:hypothetical protein